MAQRTTGSYGEEDRDRHLALAGQRLPGPDYYAALRWIHLALRPRTYIEIGIREGESLSAALPDARCLGIDPLPTLAVDSAARCVVFAMTSDEFFERFDTRQVLRAPTFDLAFIDGLHLWEQALKDFINLERLAGPQSVILLHDCLPLDGPTSARERTTDFYSGDVWKLTAALRRHRPDLALRMIPSRPTGLCVVSKLDPASTALQNRSEDLMMEFMDLDYCDLQAHPEWMPALLPNDEYSVKRWIRQTVGITWEDRGKATASRRWVRGLARKFRRHGADSQP